MLEGLLARIATEDAQARVVCDAIRARANEMRSYVAARPLDTSLEADREMVLDQHRMCVDRDGVARGDSVKKSEILTALAQSRDSPRPVPTQHDANLRSIHQRELTQSYARARLAELVGVIEREHMEHATDEEGNAARAALDELVELQQIQHARMAACARRVAELDASRRSAAGDLVARQFGADEATRLRVHRCLQLINVARTSRRTVARRALLASFAPVADAVDARLARRSTSEQRLPWQPTGG